MSDLHRHLPEVRALLQQHFGIRDWAFGLPHGTGNETYIAQSGDHRCFVKVGAAVPRAQAMAALGLSPPVLVSRTLADGQAVLVQPWMTARTPRPHDFQAHLEEVAAVVHTMHHDPALQQVLPPVASAGYRDAGMQALVALWQRWERYKPQVPAVAAFVDGALAALERQIARFSGEGLVASHNDICNANWLVTADGRWYLVDLEAMALDDPACDLGALLWWYYPPEQRPRFLEVMGYTGDTGFEHRMQVRMALHCLNITLPRPGSWDTLDPASYPAALTDFRAVLAGEENPQGYDGA
jgi:thiamine kinase-like enzyme